MFCTSDRVVNALTRILADGGYRTAVRVCQGVRRGIRRQEVLELHRYGGPVKETSHEKYQIFILSSLLRCTTATLLYSHKAFIFQLYFV